VLEGIEESNSKTADITGRKPRNSYFDTNGVTISIGANGFIEEKWDSTTDIPAKIIEVDSLHLTMECLIDPEKEQFQNRKFKRTLFEDDFKLRLDKIYLIRIRERKGKIQFEFLDGSNLGFEHYFEFSEQISQSELGKRIR
jgi:hypothetical protein